MLERTIGLALFALAVAAGLALWRWRLDRQRQHLALAELPAGLAPLLPEPNPAILYFTTPTCAQCRLQQAPALAQVQRQRAGLQVIKLDAVEHDALARFYHVMTVPTTVVLDSQRRPIAINHGLAPAGRLAAQLQQTL